MKNKKEVNPVIAERIKLLLTENKKSGRQICKFVLDNYASSNFSNFTSGKTEPPEWIIHRLSEYFKVRESWLYGYDDFKTTADLISTINKSSEMLSEFNPNENIDYATDISIKNDLYRIIDTLSFSNISIYSISDRLQFQEYMVASIQNAIEFYIKNLNKEKEKTP